MPGGHRQWFYLLSGEQAGPVNDARLRAMLRDGTLGQESVVWTPGMPDWTPVSALQLQEIDLARAHAPVRFFPVSRTKFIVLSVFTFGCS